MKLENRFLKYKNDLSPTLIYIGKKLTKIPDDIFYNISIRELANKIDVSQTSLYSFIKKIGFKNIYEFRHFFKMRKEKQSRISFEIDKTYNKFHSLNIKELLNEIKKAKEIIIFSKGFSSSLSLILSKKLKKKGYLVTEIIGENGLDMIDVKKEYFIFYISISGRSINSLSDITKNILIANNNLLITHMRPLNKKIELFKNVLYGDVSYDYPIEECHNPNNTLLLTTLLINELSNKIC